MSLHPRRLLWLLILLAPVLVWSWMNPHDRTTWWLESTPVVVGVVLLLGSNSRFPLSTLLLSLIWVHAVILLVGGHYTYAEVPLFDWLRDWTGGARNNYDKVGHFFQGFMPAILTREFLLRTSPLGTADWRPASRWLGFLCGCVPLAFSAFYELVEWWAAVLGGSQADAFLGTQGYVWDTQSDMFIALIGATVALLVLPRWHNHSLENLRGATGA
ncbi:MAG: DUF2238 domain-containing protein [Cephaloticoccus sp.]|nr:DUF2238 domain-containing protein [Cephaloticoccus sp.]MCF7761022.1 DUF2238 domain-containing protein [Cephaloticoccus sp.]